MLRRIGFAQQADEVQGEWSELVGLTAQSKPQGFDMAYPQPLLDALARCTATACHQVGLRPYTSGGGTEVTYHLNEAWDQFRSDAGAFASWEQRSVSQLRASVGLP